MGCGSSNNVTVIEVQESDNDKEPLLKESQTSLSENGVHQKIKNRQNDQVDTKVDNRQNKKPDGKQSGKQQKTGGLEKIVGQLIKPSKSPILEAKYEQKDPQVAHKQDDKDGFKDVTGVDRILAEHKEWTLSDTFWDGKRRLMSDVDRINAIDQHALNAPPNLRLQSQSLVEYLIKEARTEFEKFRSIFRWITNNIEYDVGFLNGEGMDDTGPEAVLRNGNSVCDGYSKLYQYLCSMAGLNCIKVSGLAKGGGYFPGIKIPNNLSGSSYTHAWNMINVDGAWYLCDATWAAGSVADAVFGKHVFKNGFNESWFMTEPRAFGATHLPFNAPRTIDNVNIESQLTPAPYTTCDQWNQEPLKFPAFFTTCMETVSHTSGRIESPDNQVEIALKIRYPMVIFATITAISNGIKLPREYTVTFFQDELAVVKVRLPKRGRYSLTICGHPYGINKEVESSLDIQLVTYAIIGTGDESLPPFLDQYSGLSWRMMLDGFRTSTKSPFVEAKNGEAEIEIKCRNGIKPMSYSFIHQSDVTDSKKLNNYIYGEVHIDSRIVFHIRCPKVGNYVLKLYVKRENNDKQYVYGCSFHVSCSGAPAKKEFPDGNGSFWGPNEEFGNLGITTSNTSSTVATENNGEGVLYLSLPSGIKISQYLYDGGGKSAGPQCLCAETRLSSDGSNQVNLRIRCPKAGLYRLMLFGNHDNTSSSKYVGRWMIDCKTPCDGQMFPGCQQLWGPNLHFKSLGLEVQSPSLSTVTTKKGKAILVLKCKKNANKFIHALWINGKVATQAGQCVMGEVNYEEDAMTLTYHFRLPKTGIYDFKLWGNPKTVKGNSFAGQWMIVCDEPCSKKDLFPDHFQPWGPIWDDFDRLKLQLKEPKSSTLRTDDGTCKLVIQSTRYIDAIHEMKNAKTGKSADKSAVTYTKKKEGKKHVLVIEFNVKPGSYAFELFAGGGSDYDLVGKWFIVYKE